MILPPGFSGAAFGTAAEGDARTDIGAREAFLAIGAPSDWGYASQVHGSTTLRADLAGNLGEADALVVTRLGLAVAVATADCVPVVIEGDGFAAVIHAGWRGAAAGVIESCLASIDSAGLTPRRAAVGPAICALCYEVGEDVAAAFPEHTSTTSWGTRSVDLPGIVAARLDGIPVWRSDRCTRTDESLHSFRADRTWRRQVAVGWVAVE